MNTKNIRSMIINHIRGEATAMRMSDKYQIEAREMKDWELLSTMQTNYLIHRARRDMAISILADIPKE